MKIWVHIDGQQLGPYAPDQLPLGEMDASTPVWYDGLARWTPAGEAPATASFFLPTSDDTETPAPEPEAPETEIIEESVEETTVEPAETAADIDQPAPPTPQTPPQACRRPFAPAEQTEPCPPTYLVWSILLTLCCCNPLGIIPIITGAQVSSRYNNLDIEGARRASHTTEWWVIICLVLGLMMLPFNILIYL